MEIFLDDSRKKRRTLVQPGRFLLPMDEDSSQDVYNKWRAAPLLKQPLVEEAALTLSRDLLTIEDVAADSLPPSTQLDTYVNPPEKHQQIGVDAGKKLLRGFLQNLEPPTGSRCAVLILDLSVHTCDILKAAASEHLLASSGMSTYYLGFNGGDEKLEWANHHFENWLADSFLASTVSLPKSVILPPADLPAELVEAAPPQPPLNVLTWCKSVKYEGLSSLKTPSTLVAKYHDHPRFGSEFQAVLETARAEMPLDLPEERGGGAKNKRTLPDQPGTEPGLHLPENKKQKTEATAVKLEALNFVVSKCLLYRSILIFRYIYIYIYK